MNVLPAPAGYLGDVQHDDATGADQYHGPCIERGLVRGLDVGPVQGRDRCGELVVQGTDGMARAFEILVTHQSIIPKGTYTLLGSYAWDFEGNVARPQYWTIGKRLSHHRFQKVSVSQISNFDEITRLANLGIINVFPNVLV